MQPGILADETRLARYLVFSIASAGDIATCLQDLTATTDARSTVIGCGQSLVNSLGKLCMGLHTMPSQAANGIDVPSTPMVLWCWLREFDVFDDMSTEQQDNTIGRHISDNEEFDAAPASAHVKRAAQVSFEPQAFMLRRSMPWAEDDSGGLMFVAFAKSLDAFEANCTRVLGKEAGIRDALFNFTQPLTGAYFWCPPVKDGRLDLSVLGIQTAE